MKLCNFKLSWAKCALQYIKGKNVKLAFTQAEMNFVQHHSCFEWQILPLIFPRVHHCKGEVVHLTLLFHRCKRDTVHTAVGGSMGSLAGRTVETDQGRVLLLLSVLQ